MRVGTDKTDVADVAIVENIGEDYALPKEEEDERLGWFAHELRQALVLESDNIA